MFIMAKIQNCMAIKAPKLQALYLNSILVLIANQETILNNSSWQYFG
ncbi:hypothetical protein MNBD_ALPHA11-1896 [hydrothermal vent metagenome]|uniref:Uncharacterized protein n=1 Tax=hydrothermal vent metagenome TaxID=652676 RepID=A0A3B0U0C1_9ZZZZ